VLNRLEIQDCSPFFSSSCRGIEAVLTSMQFRVSLNLDIKIMKKSSRREKQREKGKPRLEISRAETSKLYSDYHSTCCVRTPAKVPCYLEEGF